MENNKDYAIIDEPKIKFLEHLIVNPIIILFAAMLIPMLIQIPYYGRWWLPFAWLTFNGFILGSPTLIREIFYSTICIILLAGMYYLMYHLMQTRINFEFSIFKYIIIIMYGILFLFMYLVVFLQSAPYQIIQYVNGKN